MGPQQVNLDGVELGVVRTIHDLCTNIRNLTAEIEQLKKEKAASCQEQAKHAKFSASVKD